MNLRIAKFLLPLLLVANVALAGNKQALNVPTPPPAPKVTVTTPTVSLDKDHCTFKDFAALAQTFTDSGYIPLIKSYDFTNKGVSHTLMFNNELDHLAQLTVTRDDNNNITKICVDYVSDKPNGNGPAFKAFILRQHIDDFNSYLDERLKEKADQLAKEHDPAPTDPSRINFN